TQKYDLYLSYRRVDKDQMVVLRAALEKSGLTVWVDDLLPKGGDWRTAIEQAIEQSRVVVVQLSSSITEYTWIVEDIAYAQGHNIPIFPITLDKSPYG